MCRRPSCCKCVYCRWFFELLYWWNRVEMTACAWESGGGNERTLFDVVTHEESQHFSCIHSSKAPCKMPFSLIHFSRRHFRSFARKCFYCCWCHELWDFLCLKCVAKIPLKGRSLLVAQTMNVSVHTIHRHHPNIDALIYGNWWAHNAYAILERSINIFWRQNKA